jgi:hypothetical protein
MCLVLGPIPLFPRASAPDFLIFNLPALFKYT